MTDDSHVYKLPAAYRGVLQIVVFNWPFYASALLLCLSAVLVTPRFISISAVTIPIYCAVGMVVFWTISSLLVSHYVYDRSGLYSWDWLATALSKRPEHWVNIHAGLDQVSDSLLRLFPDQRAQSLDIYAAREMGEASIRRARKYAQSAISKAADPANLPIPDADCDSVFLIFAAHELRERASRQKLFLEISRSLRPGGNLVLVEHLRGWANFIAYGPGAFHFLSRREWVATWGVTQFTLQSDIGISPFVRCFILRKPL